MQINTHSSISVVPRDNFVTDPFFLAARQLLENNLQQLSQKHSKETGLLTLTCPVAGSLPWCCCCCANQAVERLGDWAPAVLIPCFNCYPDQNHCVAEQGNLVPSNQEVYTVHDPAFTTPPGQVFLTSDNFQDNYIEVTAQHQEELSQQSQLAVQKRYKMPYPVNTDMVQCSLSKDGILFVMAPWLRTP